jgi:hypothetical protein
VTPQFGASLADDSRVVIYNRNMFIVQATELQKSSTKKLLFEFETLLGILKSGVYIGNVLGQCFR